MRTIRQTMTGDIYHGDDYMVSLKMPSTFSTPNLGKLNKQSFVHLSSPEILNS